MFSIVSLIPESKRFDVLHHVD